ncbi:hypothetical protein ACOBQX_08390 [Actinokineospora sp. G85]|uniref:hypothetical protein n=1 Tax=Actinokineospora sp. G85 TaxID=3406626 RepID=UPI003C744C03
MSLAHASIEFTALERRNRSRDFFRVVPTKDRVHRFAMEDEASCAEVDRTTDFTLNSVGSFT